MKNLQADAMFIEVLDWWEKILKDYSPKDENDIRIECVAELMFLFSTQYLILNDYSKEELLNDLHTQDRLYRNRI
jgi:hypothetical protein